MAWIYAIVHRFSAFTNLLLLFSKAIVATIRCFCRMESESCGAFRKKSIECLMHLCLPIYWPSLFCAAWIPQISKGIRDGALILQRYAGHNLFVRCIVVLSKRTRRFVGYICANWIIDDVITTNTICDYECLYIDGLAQDCSNSIAYALEFLLSCAKPSI